MVDEVYVCFVLFGLLDVGVGLEYPWCLGIIFCLSFTLF